MYSVYGYTSSQLKGTHHTSKRLAGLIHPNGLVLGLVLFFLIYLLLSIYLFLLSYLFIYFFFLIYLFFSYLAVVAYFLNSHSYLRCMLRNDTKYAMVRELKCIKLRNWSGTASHVETFSVSPGKGSYPLSFIHCWNPQGLLFWCQSLCLKWKPCDNILSYSKR